MVLRHLFLLSICALLALALPACDTNSCEGGTLVIEDLELGEGEEANAGSDVTVTYVGMLENGTVFDDGPGDGEPAMFNLSGTIEGFREGISGMREGGRRRITIPPDQGYGEAGVSGRIPSCATLIFEVALIEVR